MCWLCWAAFASQPPTLVEHSKPHGLSIPMLGPFLRGATFKRGFGRCAPVPHGYDRIWCISWSSASKPGRAGVTRWTVVPPWH
jgi:hypothetical protein